MTAALLCGVLLVGGCGSSSLCSIESDLTGTWTFRFEPPPQGGGIPREAVVTADLQQVQPGAFSLGRLIWGSLTSMDTGFFDTLTIPKLTHNDGSKTGSLLGCNLSIHVPTDINPPDDSSPPTALKLKLEGSVIDFRLMAGRQDRPSQVIMNEDDSMTPREFAWSAQQQ